MQLADVVPDGVTGASIDGKVVPFSNGILVAHGVSLGASVTLLGANGSQPVPTPADTSAPPIG